MGRKIPAKKHRGVKDPLVQQAKRLQSLKGKINAPPKDPDDQPVPKSLLRLFGVKAAASKSARPRPGPPRAPVKPRAGRGGGGLGDTVARLQQLPGESARSFSRRITAATRALHAAHDPHHYPQEEEEEEDRPERRGRRRGERGVGEGGAAGGRESRARRRRAKLLLKKQERADGASADAACEAVYERISFGEQAHAPPRLPPPRLPRNTDNKKDVSASVPRPGRRDLLLSSMLEGAGAGAARLEDAERRRLAAVSAYRQLKQQRRQQNVRTNR